MRTFVLELDALPSLREAAGAHEVDLAAAATLAELAGVDAVRLGVNLDMKPVREEDLHDARRAARRLELRMPPVETLLKVALALRPDRVLLAAEGREGRAAASPLDLRGAASVAPVAKALGDAGIPVAALVGPGVEAVKRAHAEGLTRVEPVVNGLGGRLLRRRTGTASHDCRSHRDGGKHCCRRVPAVHVPHLLKPTPGLSLARAVATLLRRALRGIEFAVRALLTVLLRVAAHRFAFLRSNLVRRLGLRHCDLVVVLGGSLAGLLRLIGHVVRIVIRLGIRDVLLRISRILTRVRLGVRDVTLGVGPCVGYVVLHLCRRFCLVAACECEPGHHGDKKCVPLHVGILD
jgi:hypothetical protein